MLKMLRPLAMLAMISACAPAAYVSPVEVTRFTGNSRAILGQGTIEISHASGQSGLALAPYHDAVAARLENLGYQVVAGNAAQIARISLEQEVFDPGDGRGPVSVGVGGSTGSYRSGLGVGIGLDLTPPPAKQTETRLSLAIQHPNGGNNLWEGRAIMSASLNSDFASDEAAAGRITDALFKDFPGESGETIQIP